MSRTSDAILGTSSAIAALLIASSGAAVSIYDEGFNWFQAESDILFGDVQHCDGFLLDTESTAYCDDAGDGSSERAGFFTSATGPLRVHATCKWDIREPGKDALAEMILRVEGEGSQTVCSRDYDGETTYDTTIEAAWEKSDIIGVQTNRTVTDWLNHTDAQGDTATLDQISWPLTWVVGGVQDEAATLHDPNGDDYYSVTSPDASRWGIKDPSGDDYLEDDDGGELEVREGFSTETEGVVIHHEDLEGDAEEWIFSSEDGSPIATDLRAGSDGGRKAVTYTYS